MQDNSIDSSTEKVPIPSKSVWERLVPIICPWCNKLLRIEKWEIADGFRTEASHGICRDCIRKLEDGAT